MGHQRCHEKFPNIKNVDYIEGAHIKQLAAQWGRPHIFMISEAVSFPDSRSIASKFKQCHHYLTTVDFTDQFWCEEMQMYTTIPFVSGEMNKEKHT